MRAASLILLIVAVAASAQTIRRDGEYWLQIDSGVVPSGPDGFIKIKTRGAVTVRGGSDTSVRFTVSKRVKARSETEAAKLFAQFPLQTAAVEDGGFLAMTFPEAPVVNVKTEIRAPNRLRHVWIDTYGGDIEVYDIAGSVEARSRAGVIQMDRISGNVIGRTGGGEIRLGSIGGAVHVYSGGGSIHVERVGGEAWFETAGGEIYARESDGPIHASTAGGSIRIGRGGSSVSARTAAGRIEVQQARGVVYAGNSGGSILVGQAPGVRCESTGGSIRLTGSSGSLRAMSDVGSILAELRPGLRMQDSVLSTSTGDITVFIPSNLALTVKALSESGFASRIISEFAEIQVRLASEQGRSRTLAEGALNGGGPVLQLVSSGGAIYLRRTRY
jgi:hypothetical protein